MDELDKLKESIIDRYKMTLSLNGNDLCKEIDTVLPDDLDLMRSKAICYCNFYTNKNGVDAKLYQKCRKYLEHVHYYEKKLNNGLKIEY